MKVKTLPPIAKGMENQNFKCILPQNYDFMLTNSSENEAQKWSSFFVRRTCVHQKHILSKTNRKSLSDKKSRNILSNKKRRKVKIVDVWRLWRQVEEVVGQTETNRQVQTHLSNPDLAADIVDEVMEVVVDIITTIIPVVTEDTNMAAATATMSACHCRNGSCPRSKRNRSTPFHLRVDPDPRPPSPSPLIPCCINRVQMNGEWLTVSLRWQNIQIIVVTLFLIK